MLTDADGNEYSTFREEKRGQHTNVYLDSAEPVEPKPVGPKPVEPKPVEPTHADETAPGNSDPEEAAWQTAVAAAPWLVGEPKSAVQPKRLYDKLKPFEQYVADDVAEHQRSRNRGDEDAD